MGLFSKSKNDEEPIFEETPDYLLTGWTSFQEGDIDLGIEKCEKFLSGISKKDGKITYSTPNQIWFWEIRKESIEIVTNNLAVMYKKKGNLELAEQMWQTVSHLHYAQFNLAELARSRSNMQEAKLLYKTSASFGNYTGLAFNSYFLMKEGNTDGAVEEIKTIVEKENLEEFFKFILQDEHTADQLYMNAGLNACNILLNDLQESVSNFKEFIVSKQKILIDKIDENFDYDEFGSLQNLIDELALPERRSNALKSLIQLANEGNEKALEVLENDALKRENLMEADHWATKKRDLKSKIGNTFKNLSTGLVAGVATSAVVNSNLPPFLANLKGINEFNKYQDRLDNIENSDSADSGDGPNDGDEIDYGSFLG
jgi:hypothetical protein